MKKVKALKFLLILLIMGVSIFTSCGSDDNDSSSGSDDCPKNITDQQATGNFRGNNFIVTGGFYEDFSFEDQSSYTCTIFVKEQTGGPCSFPEFEGTEDVVIFILSSLEAQTIELNGSQQSFGNASFSFRRLEREDNGEILNIIEPTCGKLVINGIENGKLTGGVIGTGLEGSFINGNFELSLCE